MNVNSGEEHEKGKPVIVFSENNIGNQGSTFCGNDYSHCKVDEYYHINAYPQILPILPAHCQYPFLFHFFPPLSH